MRKGLLVALAFVLVANVAALSTVALNRRGEEATLVLTERELRLATADLESTALALSFAWRRPWDVAEEDLSQFAWFDRARLEAVGFDCRVPLDDPSAEAHYRRQAFAPREAYVVLEYRPEVIPGTPVGQVEQMGPAAPSRGTRPLTEADRTRLPRLATIDVGLDPGELRAHYPDRHRFVVLRGTVQLIYRPAEPRSADISLGPPASGVPAATGGQPSSLSPDPFRPPILSGTVTMVYPSEIHVPKAHRARLERLRDEMGPADTPERRLAHDPRYEVTVTWGRRLEPWVVNVQPASH